ncbi:alpha/beta hydrolase [Rivibacter subsaxonicus]|uniref:Alpha-beta hydrolase superfamily lysophospholipase n=1 Tax=Rivibacter subsaxonicus TaxID=457575 RepID=A0A4Q7VXC9_9BURK|nr:alpha/beta hydrolase [Rivibacter subsaxonicus]RZU01188.1 alpha-beta hydrolase superfamily lysophospholipase [Rivibacter subsaxonicus]
MNSTLATFDGLALARRRWPPTLDNGAAARGSVVLVHGLGEHIGRYAHVAAKLAAAGWAVSGCDLRGHGHSPGRRGDAPDGEALLRDIAASLDAARAEAPAGTPLVLLGHSLGGMLSARFVAAALESPAPAWSRAVDALLLSSPALDPGLRPHQKLMLAAARRLAPHLQVGNGLDPAWICRDPQVVADYLADPLVHDRVSATVASLVVDGGAAVIAAAPRWVTPTLLQWAGADRCVSPAGSAAFAAAAPRAALEHECYPGWSHELFNEPERERPIGRVVAWLEARFPPR